MTRSAVVYLISAPQINQVAVSVASLAQHLAPDAALAVLILTADAVAPADAQLLTALPAQAGRAHLQVTVQPLPRRLANVAQANASVQLPVLQAWLPGALPQYDCLLFLAPATLIYGDVMALFQEQLGDQVLAAVPAQASADGPWLEAGVVLYAVANYNAVITAPLLAAALPRLAGAKAPAATLLAQVAAGRAGQLPPAANLQVSDDWLATPTSDYRRREALFEARQHLLIRQFGVAGQPAPWQHFGLTEQAEADYWQVLGTVKTWAQAQRRAELAQTVPPDQRTAAQPAPHRATRRHQHHQARAPYQRRRS